MHTACYYITCLRCINVTFHPLGIQLTLWFPFTKQDYYSSLRSDSVCKSDNFNNMCTGKKKIRLHCDERWIEAGWKIPLESTYLLVVVMKAESEGYEL